jgi:sugar phosphate isomerase/epimerase
MSSIQKTLSTSFSRREFLVRTGLGAAVGALGLKLECSSLGAPDGRIPIVAFSKAYQPLKLSFTEAAALTAEAGLDGVDSPVRPDGEILPEHVKEKLPAYAEALQTAGLAMPLLTTAITGPDSPQTEAILRTARHADVKFYRLGFMDRAPGDSWSKQLSELRARLVDLAKMNKEIGIGAVFQNHSPSGRTYVGGNVDELAEIVAGFDPSQVGVAFDIAHALKVHGQGWTSRFEKIKPHLRVVYVKDTNQAGHFVPLGQGEVAGSGYFKVLRATGYHAPISLHIEYDGPSAVQPATRPALLKALKDSVSVLKSWLSAA